jgi:uncharacterized protein YndB with AHSA1/START domain
MMSSHTGDLVREVRIAAAPRDVFAYFTDPRKLVVWKATTAESDARPGGLFQMDVTGRGDIARGEYLQIDPPHRITFSWTWDSSRMAVSVVEVTLTPDGDGTLLRLVHRGIPDPDQVASAAGWAHYLARLALAAAGHDPGPDPWAGQAQVPQDVR